ncbi:hypothetical protein B0J14DRAFT_679227 [Halenospora varia]|nr:hypothetical protein B0J14DRAFT_679227 [Halenospora varia]
MIMPTRLRKKKPRPDPNDQKPEEKKPKDKKPKEKKLKKDGKKNNSKKDESLQPKHARDFSIPGKGILNSIGMSNVPEQPQIQATLRPANPDPSFFETWQATAEAIFIPMIIFLMALAISYTLYSLILKGTELLLDMRRGNKLGEEFHDVELCYEDYGVLRLSGKMELWWDREDLMVVELGRSEVMGVGNEWDFIGFWGLRGGMIERILFWKRGDVRLGFLSDEGDALINVL